jgi:drug/metabolite transporter (DMT)-like permease
MFLGIPLWLLYSFSTAILWGLGYLLAERVMAQGIQPSFLILCQALIVIPFYFVIAYFSNDIYSGLSILKTNKQVLLFTIFAAFTVLGGNLLILTAITYKNAVLTSMIEISYPLFIIIFSWLLFKDVQITLWTAIGGLFIFIGSCILFWKS